MPGTPAPWAELSAERRLLTADSMRTAIGTQVLDTSAVSSDGVGPAAAVLAVIEPAADGELEVIITRRSERMRTHRGELSFPGGAQDPGEDLMHTALREANEEVGLDGSSVDVAGRLSPLRTASSGRWVVPFVALASDRPEVWPASPDEVDEVLHVPLAHLTAPGVFWEEHWTFGPDTWPISFFDLGPDVIWGATAAMLRDLLARLLGTPVPPRQDPATWIKE